MIDDRWRGRRVVVVAAFDSFLRAGATFGRFLAERGADVTHRVLFARAAQMSSAQIEAAGIEPDRVETALLDALCTRAALGDRDVIVLCLDGLRTRRFMVRFHRAFEGAPTRPVVVCLYPGILFRFHLEGMEARMASDLFLLNSPSDVALYESMLAGMGLDNVNGICGGLSFLPSTSEREPPRDGHVLFVAQPTVPAGALERAYVVERLFDLAEAHPETEWVIKPRHRRDETTLHRADHLYEDLVDAAARRRRRPPNLLVRHEPIAASLERARLCLTFSSTAALEAIAWSVPTRVLTDVGIDENVGSHFFLGSGLCATFDEIRPDLPFVLDAEWRASHVAATRDRLPEVLDRLEALLAAREASPHALPPPYPRRFGRAPALERFIEERADWREVGEVGKRGDGPHRRWRRAIRPLRAFVRDITEWRRMR